MWIFIHDVRVCACVCVCGYVNDAFVLSYLHMCRCAYGSISVRMCFYVCGCECVCGCESECELYACVFMILPNMKLENFVHCVCLHE